MTADRPILLVEDDRVDAMAVKRTLAELGVGNELLLAGNGETALELLKGGKPRPGIVLLDINMPRMNGFELLEKLKQDDDLKTIPIVILTTSANERDRARCFKLGVAGYMVKPVEYRQFQLVMKTITDYWLLSELAD